MDNVLLVHNHSVKHFTAQCGAVSRELEKRGCLTRILSNSELSLMKELPSAGKCVFYDKDIPLGLRLELKGMRLFNSIGAVELCGDKCRSYEMLSEFPQPETLIYPKTFFPDDKFFGDYSEYVVQTLSLPVIAKLADGSQGREVFLLKTFDEVTEFQKRYYKIPHLYQKFIEASKGTDIRVFVIGCEVYASMIRSNPNDFRSNIALGGKAKKTEIGKDIKELCVSVTSFLGLDFAGLDILLGKDGEPYICEVNSNALFTTLSSVCEVNIAAGIAEHVLKAKNGVADIGELFT